MTFIKSVVSKAFDGFEELFSENFSIAGVFAAHNIERMKGLFINSNAWIEKIIFNIFQIFLKYTK